MFSLRGCHVWQVVYLWLCTMYTPVTLMRTATRLLWTIFQAPVIFYIFWILVAVKTLKTWLRIHVNILFCTLSLFFEKFNTFTCCAMAHLTPEKVCSVPIMNIHCGRNTCLVILIECNISPAGVKPFDGVTEHAEGMFCFMLQSVMFQLGYILLTKSWSDKQALECLKVDSILHYLCTGAWWHTIREFTHFYHMVIKNLASFYNKCRVWGLTQERNACETRELIV